MEKICLTNISKTYYENEKISFHLKKLSLTIVSPMLLIIKGISGSGKSTLINLISGLEKIDSGTITYYINEKKVERLKINNIFQDYKLFLDQSVYFNISLPLKISGNFNAKSEAYLKNLMEKFNIAPLKNKMTSLLSGGEKQRVAIIRALSAEPNIIIADEPTGSLDFKNGEQVFEILKEISKNKLVIVVTHNDEFAVKYADRLIEIRDGSIIKDEMFGEVESECKKENNAKLHEKNKKIGWMFNIIKTRFLKTKVRLSVILAATIFCATFMLASLSFLSNAPDKFKLLMSNYKNYGIFNISKVTEIKSDNQLFKLTKTTRPELYEIINLKKYIASLEVYYSLGAIFDEYVSLTNESEVIDGIRFSPIFDEINLKYDEVYINDILALKLKENKEYKISFIEKIYEKENILDAFNLTINLNILGTIDEFKFMNTPVIYYNYFAFESLIKEYELVNFTIQHNYYTWYDALLNAKGDEAISNYSLIIKVDKTQVDLLIDLINSQDKDIDKTYYQLSAFSLDIKRSLDGLLSTLEIVLIVFISLSIAGTVLIIALFTYTNFYEFSYESAIILTLGGTKYHIFLMFIIYNLIVFYISFFASGIIIIFAGKQINGLINAILTINHLINFNFRLFAELLTFGSLGIILLSMISVILGYKNGLMKVLKEQ